MQVSGHKEHLSVTSAISVCEGSAASELQRGCELTDGKFSSAVVKVMCVLWNVTTTISGRHLEKRTHHFFGCDVRARSRNCPVSEEPDKCLAERKISRREQLYWTLSAKDSLFLRLVDDV